MTKKMDFKKQLRQVLKDQVKSNPDTFPIGKMRLRTVNIPKQNVVRIPLILSNDDNLTLECVAMEIGSTKQQLLREFINLIKS